MDIYILNSIPVDSDHQPAVEVQRLRKGPILRGRVELGDEAFDLGVFMVKIERLDGAITWIDLSFVARERTPGCTIRAGIRCHSDISI